MYSYIYNYDIFSVLKNLEISSPQILESYRQSHEIIIEIRNNYM